VVAKSQNQSLGMQLLDFILGEKDGIPKDQNYIYRLYMALKKYDEAAKTAMIIAQQELERGCYALANAVLVETIRKLEDLNMKVPLLMRQIFILLHSYELVKTMIKRQEHYNAAKLLLRVAQNISRFPRNKVPSILTATVIECQLAGLKASSYEYAVTLVRPEYRSELDPNIKRKIEAVVRRRAANTEDIPEELSLCPLSNQLIPSMLLECPTTKDSLPMCIITGKHMLIDDWCVCPNSGFPALYSEYCKYIQFYAKQLERSTVPESDYDIPTSSSSSAKSRDMNVSAPDPILGKSVTMNDLVKITPEEALAYIKKYNNVFEKKEEEENNDTTNDDGKDKMENEEENEENRREEGLSSPMAKGRSSRSNKNNMSSTRSKAAKAKERIQRSKKSKKETGHNNK
jgi:WD repeat-containing protein 19